MLKYSQLRWLAAMLTISSFLLSCDKAENNAPEIRVLAADINGQSIAGLTAKQPTSTTITLTFGSALNANAFKDQLQIQPEEGVLDQSIAYQIAGSKAVINLTLASNTNFSFQLNAAEIGVNGEVLKEPFTFDFLTITEDETITSTDPCISNCLETTSISGEQFSYYSNYPLYPDNARWEALKTAIIVVHGANRNANEYYAWLNNSLQETELTDETILISPLFKVEEEAETGEMYWSGNNWREGDPNISVSSLSSFEVIDSLVAQLGNNSIFPNLERVIVTGHSSGALFSYLYGAANRMESSLSSLNFQYIIANSQYFYYPDEQRYSTANQSLYTPTNCNGYTTWPLGYTNAPSYLDDLGQETLNDQLRNRNILYLLGNGTASDGAFNNTNCAYQLLGDSRYQRGENMFAYINLKYETNNHQRYIVEGIGHNGQAMYSATEFKNLLNSLVNN